MGSEECPQLNELYSLLSPTFEDGVLQAVSEIMTGLPIDRVLPSDKEGESLDQRFRAGAHRHDYSLYQRFDR